MGLEWGSMWYPEVEVGSCQKIVKLTLRSGLRFTKLYYRSVLFEQLFNETVKEKLKWQSFNLGESRTWHLNKRQTRKIDNPLPAIQVPQ